MTTPLFADYHMHPQAHRLQRYSQELLRPWADAARARGIRDFALTDHDRYCEGVCFDAIDAFREAHPDLAIRAGIELDNDPETSAAGRAWVERHWDRLDFVLGSVHYLTGADRMFDSAGEAAQFDALGTAKAYELYLHELRALIGRGHIDCLAHLDLIKIHRYFPEAPLDTLFKPILELVRQHDLAIEISTAGWRKPVGEHYPHRDIVRVALSMGIPMTIASDAHSHAQMGESYDRLAALLKEWGVTTIALFHQHQRTLVPIV